MNLADLAPKTFVEALVGMFHAVVILLGLMLIWYSRQMIILMTRQRRLDEATSHRLEFEKLWHGQPIAHLQRIADAANDWYDDKKGSKERLRVVIAQSRGEEPFKLIQRPTDEKEKS